MSDTYHTVDGPFGDRFGRYRADLAWEDALVVIQYDGGTKLWNKMTGSLGETLKSRKLSYFGRANGDIIV